MMNEKNLGEILEVYVWTSNVQMVCMPAWAYLFNKFWPYNKKVTVIGYDFPDFKLPANFKYVSLGTQRGPKFWSDDMISYFSNVSDDLFYMTTEDGFLVDDVDKEIQHNAARIAPSKSDFAKLNLTANLRQRAHTTVERAKRFDLIKADQTAEYRNSLHHSIFEREKFLHTLVPGQTPWEYELDFETASKYNHGIYGTSKEYALKVGHGYKKGRKIPNWYSNLHANVSSVKQLNKSDIAYIEKNNWVPPI